MPYITGLGKTFKPLLCHLICTDVLKTGLHVWKDTGQIVQKKSGLN